MSELISGRVSFAAGGRAVLDQVEVGVREGESVAIVGANGAGKTTLLRLLANVLAPSDGELALRGTPYTSLPARKIAASLAYVPQIRPARVPLTVRDVVLLGRYPHHRVRTLGYEARDFEAARRALEMIGASDLSERPLNELSGGERQSVYIAAALAQETECLLLDEPTTYLDPGHQRRIAHLLRKLTRDQGRTLVFASHDLNLAYALADRVLALAGGAVVATGPTAEILEASTLETLYGSPFHAWQPTRTGSAHPVVAVDLSSPERGESE